MSYAMVYLDIKDTAPETWQHGYTSTTSTGGEKKTYWYKYSAGTDGMGGVTFKTGTGVAVVEVNIGPDRRYRIKCVIFKENEEDLSWTSGATSRSAFIIDTDVHDLDDRYSIKVLDRNTDCKFICDPPIKNKP